MTRTDDIIPSEWWPDLDGCIAERDIPAFPTKALRKRLLRHLGGNRTMCFVSYVGSRKYGSLE